jgi:hypothetical protein
MEKVEVTDFAYKYAKVVEQWCKQEVYKDFTLNVKLDWSPKRRSSRGGMYHDGPGINIAMSQAWPNSAGYTYRFHEYASYDADKIIGGFYSTDPYHKVEAVVLHEIAHALQFVSYKKNNITCKPHGPIFKNFYKRLRTQFLNHKLPEQVTLKKDYDDYVASLNNKNIVTMKEILEITRKNYLAAKSY